MRGCRRCTGTSRTQGLDRLELIRFLQVSQTITVHHAALAFLLGINALRASEAAAVSIEDYAETLRGRRVLHLVGKGNKPATMPVTVPVLRVLEACRGDRTTRPLILRPLTGNPIGRRDAYRMVARIAKTAGIPAYPGTSAPTRYGTPRSPTPLMPASRCAMLRSWPATPTHAPPSTTTAPGATSTGTAFTSSPPTSLACDAGRRLLSSYGCVLAAQNDAVAECALTVDGRRATSRYGRPRRQCRSRRRK